MEHTLRHQVNPQYQDAQVYMTLLECEWRKTELLEKEICNLNVTLKCRDERIEVLELQLKVFKGKMRSMGEGMVPQGAFGDPDNICEAFLHNDNVFSIGEVQETNQPPLTVSTPDSDSAINLCMDVNGGVSDLFGQMQQAQYNAMGAQAFELQSHPASSLDGVKPLLYPNAGGNAADPQVIYQGNLSMDEISRFGILEQFKNCVLSLPVDLDKCPCPVDLDQPPYDIAGIGDNQQAAMAMITKGVKLRFWAYLRRAKLKNTDPPAYRRTHLTGTEGRWLDIGTHLNASARDLFPDDDLRKHVVGRRLKWEEKGSNPSKKWSWCQWMLDEYIAVEARGKNFPVVSTCPQLDHYPHLGYFELWAKEPAKPTSQPRKRRATQQRGNDGAGPSGEGFGSDDGSEHGGGPGHFEDMFPDQGGPDIWRQGNGGGYYGGAQHGTQLQEFDEEEALPASDVEDFVSDCGDEAWTDCGFTQVVTDACSNTGGTSGETSPVDDLQARLQALRTHAVEDGEETASVSATRAETQPLQGTGIDDKGDNKGPSPHPPFGDQQVESPAVESGRSLAPSPLGSDPTLNVLTATPPAPAASAATVGDMGKDRDGKTLMPAGDVHVEARVGDKAPTSRMELPFPVASPGQELHPPLQQPQPSAGGPLRYPDLPPPNLPATGQQPGMMMDSQQHQHQQQHQRLPYMHPGVTAVPQPYATQGFASFGQAQAHMFQYQRPTVLCRSIMALDGAVSHPQAQGSALRRHQSAMTLGVPSGGGQQWQQQPQSFPASSAIPARSPGAASPNPTTPGTLTRLVDDVTRRGFAREVVETAVRSLITSGWQPDVSMVISYITRSGSTGQSVPSSFHGRH